MTELRTVDLFCQFRQYPDRECGKNAVAWTQGPDGKPTEMRCSMHAEPADKPIPVSPPPVVTPEMERAVFRKIEQSEEVKDYERLLLVLGRAFDQASKGKGKERHATNEPFHEQQIVQFGRWLGSTDFQVGQACKKAIESKRLPKEKAIGELLGAINYLAAAVILLEDQRDDA